MDEPEIDYIETDTTCNICYAEFLDLEDLEIHRDQVHAIGLFSCQFCSTKQRSMEAYAVHIRDVHILNLKICEFCKRVFTDESYCRKHEKKHMVHRNKSKFSCSVCEFQFNNTIDLEGHEFTIHRTGDVTEGIWLQDYMPHLSSVLNMNFINLLQLTPNKFICAACGSTCESLIDYIEHLRRENCRSLACNTCSNVYKSRKGISKHFSVHSQCNNYIYKNVMQECSECLEQFPMRALKTHRRSCKAIKCQNCQIVFENMEELSKHQIEEHPLVISVLNCKYCKREFVGKLALKKHIERSHDAKRYKYNCAYCEMMFQHPKKLFAHLYTKHKEIEPYFCEICNKKFRVRKSFTLHIKLVHKSVGCVEHDEKFHITFKEKKSENNKDNNDVAIDPQNSETVKDKGSETDRSTTSLSKMSKSSPKMDVTIEIQSKVNTTVDSDFTTTDTEAPTEDENKVLQPRRKLKSNEIEQVNVDDIISDSSDDVPLNNLKSKMKNAMKKRGRPKKTQSLSYTKFRFTCKFCNKNCDTFRNYHHHLNTAHQNEKVKCVKCLKTFGSKMKLRVHIAKEHSSSKLTETLKKILEQRKTVDSPVILNTNDSLSNTEKFKKTIKKAKDGIAAEPAVLTTKSSELSVQKFIESFTPESNENKKSLSIVSNVDIKPVICPPKSSIIKLTKFEPKRTDRNISRAKLAMPIRFKPDESEPANVTVKVVHTDEPPPMKLIENFNNVEAFYDNNDNYGHYEEMVMDKQDYIPEVAQEVMLEGSEEATKKPPPQVHKIIIPKIPDEVEQIRIATLLPEAPFYKIHKIKDVLKTPKEKAEVKAIQNIKLPNGTKLVNVNPLAHLLGDTPIEKVLENIKGPKYYQPKMVDFEKAVAKALLNERPPQRKRRKIKVEQ